MKTRTITKYRWVPHTVDGETELIREPYTIDVPVPPADWDQRVRTAVTAVAGVLVTASVVWSTASIGELLARMVTVGAAYFAAITFDSLWIMCTAVEWLLRAEPDRAQKARAGGILALIVAMGAVFANGYLAGQPIIGAVGAAVSALAKGATALAMAVHARPLDARTRQWVAKRRAALNGQLAMIPIRRELQRGLGVLEAERATIAADEPQNDAADHDELPETRPRRELHGPAGTPVDDLLSLRSRHGQIVYFLGNGNRVKIGTTSDLLGRLSALCLRPSNLLCAFHGGHDIESQFHRRFAAYRVGDTEWFEITGELAQFIAEHTADATSDAVAASGDAPDDAGDAGSGAEEISASLPPLPPLPMGASKSALILAASSTLQPGASAADIAHLLAQRGHAVDTAYIRTVLSRKKADDEGIGKGGGGYV